MCARAVALVVTLLAVAGCGGSEAPVAQPTPTATASSTPTATATAAVGEDCPKDLDGDPRRQPPSSMGVLSYAHLYKSAGRSFYAVLDGTPDELLARRDDAQNELVQNWGFASLGTAEKAGAEATAHLEGGGHSVDVRVTPLCEGKLQIRYTVR